jgi:PTS system nitrogen regulatory IIA component
MFNLASMLTLQRTLCGAHEKSKKRIFEAAAAIIGEDQPHLNSADIFAALNARERLGSTAMGQGIAVPHCRISNCSKTIGTLITLDKAINFEAPDNQPVDIIFVLLVPEQAHEDHLNTLAALARLFSTANYCQSLRLADTNQTLYGAATAYDTESKATPE